MVVDKTRGIFAGTPLADAYLSNREHPYRGVGVHVTSAALAWMQERTKSHPVPLHLTPSFSGGLLHGTESLGRSLVWHSGFLFIDHWVPQYTAGPMTEERVQKAITRLEGRFAARALPTGDAEKLKLRQTLEFLFSRIRAGHNARPELPTEILTRGLLEDLLSLSAMGLADQT